MADATFMKTAASVPDAYTDLNSLQKLRNNPDQDKALRQVAEQFESMFLSLLLKNMRSANAVFEQDSPFNSNESGLVRDMYDQQLSLNMAQGKGTGLAEVLYRQLRGQYGSAEPVAPSADASGSMQTLLRRAQASGESAPATRVDTAEKTSATRSSVADTPAQFVEKLAPYAKAAAARLGVDPLVLIAQAALETGWGKQVLAKANGESSNNVFNIKSAENWQGESVSLQALEYQGGSVVRENSRFKAYGSMADSFSDFVELVQGNPRYAAANRSEEPRDFVQALHSGGYATDPHYTDKVLAVYNTLKAEFGPNATAPGTDPAEQS